MLSTNSPEYIVLAEELQKVSDAAQGINALVFDEAGLIWCTAFTVYAEERPLLYEQMSQVLESMDPPLNRGGKLDRTLHGETHHLYCKSFAQIYVVGVWFDKPVGDELQVHRAVRDSLTRIEELTLHLPPPDGPDRHAGVASKPIA